MKKLKVITLIISILIITTACGNKEITPTELIPNEVLIEGSNLEGVNEKFTLPSEGFVVNSEAAVKAYLEVYNTHNILENISSLNLGDEAKNTLVRIQKNHSQDEKNLITYSNPMFLAYEKKKHFKLDNEESYLVLKILAEASEEDSKRMKILEFYFKEEGDGRVIEYVQETFDATTNLELDYQKMPATLKELEELTQKLAIAYYDTEKEDEELINTYKDPSWQEEIQVEPDKDKGNFMEEEGFERTVVEVYPIFSQFYNSSSITYGDQEVDLSKYGSVLANITFVMVEKTKSKLDGYRDDEVHKTQANVVFLKGNEGWKLLQFQSPFNMTGILNEKDVAYNLKEIHRDFNLEEQKIIQERFNNIVQEEELSLEYYGTYKDEEGSYIEILARNYNTIPYYIEEGDLEVMLMTSEGSKILCSETEHSIPGNYGMILLFPLEENISQIDDVIISDFYLTYYYRDAHSIY